MKAKNKTAQVHPLNFTLYPFSEPQCLSGRSDFRHVPVREEIWRVYNEENNDLQCPWSGKHAKILQRVLATAMNWEVKHWHTCILNRFASEGVNAAEDPAQWLPRLASWRRQPLNRFGKTDHVPEMCWIKRDQLCERYWQTHPEEESEARSQESEGGQEHEG
jgi:hypothetical protein